MIWLLAGIWLTGSVVGLYRIIGSLVIARRLVSRGTVIADERCLAAVDELARHFSLARRPGVVESAETISPLCLGCRRSTIVLPVQWRDWSADQLRAALAHEMAHVVRRDVAWQLLAQFACALYWFHPLVWLAARRMRVEREVACDDSVVNAGERPSGYARLLLALATELADRRGTARANAVAMAGSRHVERRIRAVLNPARRRSAVTRRGAWGMAAAAAASLLLAGIVSPYASIHAGNDSRLATMPDAKPAAPANDASSRENTATKEAKPNQSAVVAVKPAEKKNYEFPISVSGRALDLDGKPISGAKIYLASRAAAWKRLAEATSDEKGRYKFDELDLPIERATTNSGRDAGAFEVFGQAAGYGFAWRPRKSFYPKPRPAHIRFEPGPDEPSRYVAGDKIELDLTFPPAQTLRGRIVDDRGKPIPDTLLSIRYSDPIPPEGYSAERRFSTSSSRLGFESLNERESVPPEMKIRRTDADGRFEFTDLPPNCRFRIDARPPGFPRRWIWAATQKTVKGVEVGYRLYTSGMEVTFATPRDVRVRVLYDDTGEPAPKVLVEGYNREASSLRTTDREGYVTLRLPPGSYTLHLLPQHGTPYLVMDRPLEIVEVPPKEAIVSRLRRAAVVEVTVLDVETGKGLAEVDLWREKREFSADGIPRHWRQLHYFRSWEVETRIAHVERPRTNSKGVLRALFEPGRHLIGVGMESFPKGYEVVEKDGQEIEGKVRKPTRVTFHLRKRR